MKILHLSAVIFVSAIILLPQLSVLGQAVNRSPNIKPEFTVKMDKMYYNNTDTAHLNISGPPSAQVNLSVIDSSSQQKLATMVQLDPNGTRIFSFNLTSFSYGICHAIVGQGYDKTIIDFGVGLLPSGPHIVVNTPKFDFVDGEIIPISGHTQGNSSVYIFLLDNYGNIENSTQVMSDDTGSFFANLVIPSHVIGGGWYLFAKSGEGNWMSEIMVNTHGVSTMTLHISNLPPLKQFRLGIDPYHTVCRQDLQLMIKLKDNSPACVKSTSIERLLKQGWVNAYDRNGK